MRKTPPNKFGGATQDYFSILPNTSASAAQGYFSAPENKLAGATLDCVNIA